MKRYIVEYIFKDLVCQQVKIEHQYLSKYYRICWFLNENREQVSMNLMLGIPKIQQGHDGILACGLSLLSPPTLFSY